MDGRLTWTDCDEAGDYVVPNVLSPRDLVFRPDNMDETVSHTSFYLKARCIKSILYLYYWYLKTFILTDVNKIKLSCSCKTDDFQMTKCDIFSLQNKDCLY